MTRQGLVIDRTQRGPERQLLFIFVSKPISFSIFGYGLAQGSHNLLCTSHALKTKYKNTRPPMKELL